jgi:2-polyprenyl-3-methyl-5-hydroxy-6-metoxy-1,4-benzoquinol methylase/spore maturation protein CgeB
MADSSGIVVSDKMHARMQAQEADTGLAVARDRIAQAYLGQWGSRETIERSRNRIHWLGQQVRGRRVLDVGCSEGILALLLAREGFEVTGVDLNREAIQYATELVEREHEEVRQRIRFICANIATLEPTRDQFDTLVLGEVIEHVVNPHAFLERCFMHLKPGGTCVLTTPFGILPNIDHKQTFVGSQLTRLLGPFMEVEHLSIADGYLRVVGRSHPNGNGRSAPAATDAHNGASAADQQVLATAETDAADVANPRLVRDLLAETEQALLASQRKLWTRLAELREANTDLREKQDTDKYIPRQEHDAAVERLRQSHQTAIDQAYAERERALGELRRTWEAKRKSLYNNSRAREEDLRDQIKVLTRARDQAEKRAAKAASARDAAERQAARFKAKFERQGDQLEFTRAQLKLLQQEVRYRLGDALVSAFYHPLRVFSLPFTFLRLLREGQRRRTARAAAEAAEARALIPLERPAQPPSQPKPDAPPPAPPTPTRSTTPAAELTPAAATTPAAEPAATPDEPAERRIEFTPPIRAAQPPRLGMHVAAIMDEFTYECFRDECRLTTVGTKDWKQKLSKDPPQLLFVESTWRGNGGQWKLQYEKCDPLRELVSWCRSNQIPTLFWNKEDPPNFDRFIHSAGVCDYVFTSDANCIPKYRERLGHDRVAALPFAAQPTIHNPIGSLAPRLGNFCFAGTYYRVKYPQRRRDIETLLGPASRRGLTIFDRKHGYAESDLYRFPDQYKEMIYGGLSYPEMLAAYKAYHVFLNVNSVRESPTMYSRRVLELLACGTAVISTPSAGMEEMLGRDAVAIADSEEAAADWMDRLINDPELRRRMIIRGQRRVFDQHTYEHRMAEILATLGIHRPRTPRRVSVVTVTNRPAMLANAIANYTRQAYPDKEWLLVLNSDDFSLPQVQEQVAHLPNVRVFQRPPAHTLGACLNFAIDQTELEFVAKFDDDDFYGEQYLTDQLHAFLYCDTDIVGKRSYLAHLTGTNQLALRFPGYEHSHCVLVAGATLVVRRALFNEVRFREDVERGVDTFFERACSGENGHGIYSTDRYNFVASRSTGAGHTWSISDQEFLEKCQLLPDGTDPRQYTTV